MEPPRTLIGLKGAALLPPGNLPFAACCELLNSRSGINGTRKRMRLFLDAPGSIETSGANDDARGSIIDAKETAAMGHLAKMDHGATMYREDTLNFRDHEFSGT